MSWSRQVRSIAKLLAPVTTPRSPVMTQRGLSRRFDTFDVPIEAYRDAWKEAGHRREPRVSVSRSIFPLIDDRDRAFFGREGRGQDQIGYIDADTRAIFGRSYAGEPEEMVRRLAADEAIAAADTLLLTVPDQLGVAYNAAECPSGLQNQR